MSHAEVKLLDAHGNVLATIDGHVKGSDPREVVWKRAEVEREGLYDHAELWIDGVQRGTVAMKFNVVEFHKGNVLSPWGPLRFDEPLTATPAAPARESPAAPTSAGE